MSKLIDLTNMKFGRLTVIDRAENDKQGRARWLCSCECGNKVIVEGTHLRRGQKACSCLIKEGNRKTHGMTNSKIYNVWCSMKARCLNASRKDYNRYGGRGITIYPAWIDDFQSFYDYVSKLEHFGEKGYTLDRIDNSGNYEPGNLRWANNKTQARNTRKNPLIEYNGKKITIPDAAELSGISQATLHTRYYAGDRGEKLFRPVAKNHNNHAKITEDEVKQIRKLYSTGEYSQYKLAEMFNIGRAAVGLIVNNKTWRNVES